MTAEEELEKIKSLREKDEKEAMHIFLGHQIYDAQQKLNFLQKMKERLENRYNALNETMKEVESENDRLSEEFCEPPMKDDPRGSFFDQLRNLEAIQEHLRGQVEGLKSVNHSIHSEINKTANQIRLFNAQLSELQEQLSSADSERARKSGTLLQTRNRLAVLDDELDTVTNECQKIKETIKNKAYELRGVSEESIATLIAQKRALENELKAKKEKLTQLKNYERDLAIKNTADTKIRLKKQKFELSPNVWMSQRLSLVSKVKKAKDELYLLNCRQKGNSKSSTRINSIKENNRWTDEDAKYAIACEIAELQKEPPKFLMNAFNTELTFKKEMEAALDDIEKTTQKIAEFKENTMELMHEQEITAGKEERLHLLKKELAELRSKI